MLFWMSYSIMASQFYWCRLHLPSHLLSAILKGPYMVWHEIQMLSIWLANYRKLTSQRHSFGFKLLVVNFHLIMCKLPLHWWLLSVGLAVCNWHIHASTGLGHHWHIWSLASRVPHLYKWHHHAGTISVIDTIRVIYWKPTSEVVSRTIRVIYGKPTSKLVLAQSQSFTESQLVNWY